MKIFSFTKLGRMLMLSVVVALSAVCWVGCGGDDDSSGGGGNGSLSTGLVCADGEAWVEDGKCASATIGLFFKSNGDYAKLIRSEDGVWFIDGWVTWRTDGNKLIFKIGRSYGDSMQYYEESVQYEISNGTLVLIESDGGRRTFKKCNGLNVRW